MNKPTFKHICLMHIQQLTNFPYIEKDFDALTDYGLLCKVVDYLNQVIASENTQNENIVALYNAFTELKNYVENFFDNLDVQDEINNKLDEMAEDGTLNQIIEQYLNSSAIWGFNTVADMKSATNLINGSYARTLGYYAANDGGGANYIIRNNAPSGYYETLDNGKFAELINDEINVLQYGCINDGLTSNTSKFNDILALAIKEHKNIYIPKGEYNGNFTIDLTQIYPNGCTYAQSNANIKIRGDGYNTKLLNETGSIIKIKGTNKNENNEISAERLIKNIIIKDILIDGINKENNNIAMELESCQHLTFENIIVRNCHGGLIMKGCMDNNYVNLDIEDVGVVSDKNSYVLHATNSALTNNSTNAIKFVNTRVETSPCFMYLEGNTQIVQFTNLKYEMASVNLSNIYRPIHFAGCKNILITNGNLHYSRGHEDYEGELSENNNLTFIKSDSLSALTYNSGDAIIFNSCIFTTPPSSKALWFTGYRTTFNNCEFNACDGNFINSKPLFLNSYSKCINSKLLVKGGSGTVILNGTNSSFKDNNILIEDNAEISQKIISFEANANGCYAELPYIPNLDLQTFNPYGYASVFNNNGVINIGNNKYITKGNLIYNAGYTVYNRGQRIINLTGSLTTISGCYDGMVVNIVNTTENNININNTGNISLPSTYSLQPNNAIQLICKNGIFYKIS